MTKKTANVVYCFGSGASTLNGGFQPVPTGTTDLMPRIRAEFVAPFKSLIDGVGLSRVAGLVPIDWTTATFDQTLTTVQLLGTDWFYLNDAQHAAGQPIYITIQYRIVKVANARYWAIVPTIIISTALTSAGVPQGAMTTKSWSDYGQFTSTNWVYDSADQLFPFFFVVEEGFIAMRFGSPTTHSSMPGFHGHLMVERLRNSFGESDTSVHGYAFVHRSINDGGNSGYGINGFGSIFDAAGVIPINSRYTTSPSLKTPVFPVFQQTPAGIHVSRHLVGVIPNDMAIEEVATLPTIEGGNAPYRSVGNVGNGFGMSSSATGRLAIRWAD